MKKFVILSILAALCLSLLLAVFIYAYREQEAFPSEGVIVYALDTRLPDRVFIGIKDGVRIGTGRGIWKQPLEKPFQQAHLLQPCSQKPWCVYTDSPTHVVIGCGQSGTLYDIRGGQRIPLTVPAGTQLIALSLRKSFAVLTSGKNVLQISYKIAGGQIVWTSRRILQDIPSPQSIYFAPTGTAVLMESGGWTYLLPALGQKAEKVIKGNAIGWIPNSEYFLIYEYDTNKLVKYSINNGKIDIIPKYYDNNEKPVAISPDGKYIVSLITRFDMRRVLPEVKAFRIRKVNEPGHIIDIEAGWGVGKVCWLLE